MNLGARIFVAGGDTLIGRTLVERLQIAGYQSITTLSSLKCADNNTELLEDFFSATLPEYVFFAAGASGGIKLNQQRPAALMVDNLYASTHIIDLSYRYRVCKLLYLASSCVYPKEAPQPMRVQSLMTGPLEPTNEAYATAKLAGLKLCEAYRLQYNAVFIAGIPANPFGPYDDFSPDNGHVIPALIRRMYFAKMRRDDSVTIWGTGKPRRDFIYSEDLADACLHVMSHYDGDVPINIGCQSEYSIAETAQAIAEIVGFDGNLVFDDCRPDGMFRKTLDAEPLFQLGWRPKNDFRQALEKTYEWFLTQSVREEDARVRAIV